MALAETARLIASLELKDLFTKTVNDATKSLGKLDKSIDGTGSRAFKAGQQIGTGIKRGALIAVSAATGLAALFLKIAKEGQNAADVQTVFAKAISNSGKVTAANVAALKAQEAALLNLGGVDDELIKQEQTRLIQMGETGNQVLKLTPLILDLSKATGKDLLQATTAVGKAAAGSAGSLQRFGVFVDKAKFKVDPFNATMEALAKKFGGTTAALSGSLNTKLDVFRERLANIREEAGIKLLPSLVKLVDVVTQKLLPAFQSFIDAVLPSVIKGIDELTKAINSGDVAKGLTGVFNTIKVAAPIIEKSAQATFTIVKAAVDLFTSLPESIQSLAVGAFAVNKLTGGLVTNVGGGIADFVAGKLGLLRGQTPATPLFVSDVTGGLGGVAGAAGAAGEAGGAVSLLSKGLRLLPWVGFGLLIADGFNQFASTIPQPQGAGGGKFGTIFSGTGPRNTGSSGLANPILDRGGRETGTSGIIGNITKLINAGIAAVKNGFANMIKALHEARGTEAIRKAVKEATHQVAQLHKGNATNTAKTVTELRAALARTHDPKLTSEIKTALAKVQSFLPGRRFAVQQLDAAQKLLRDGKVSQADLKAIGKIETDLKNRGLPHAADVIKAKVHDAQVAEVKATNAAAQAIRDKQFTAQVNTVASVSIRDIQNATAKLFNFGGAGRIPGHP